MATAANPAVGIASSVLGSLGSLLTVHHQKAVVTENNVLGSNVPATEEAFKKIMDNFSAGMIDAGTAISKLQQAVDSFKSATASIRKQSGQAGETGDPKAGGKCNAACVYLFRLQKEADDLKAQINAGTGGNVAASGVKVGARSVSNGGGLPTQQFSILPNLTGNNLALALGGVFLFVAAVVIAMAARKRTR